MRTAFSAIFISCLIFPVTVFAQRMLKGKVTDESNGQPVVASVFLSNTSIGTTSSANGAFELKIPEGRYELVISSVGYDTYVYSVAQGISPSDLDIKLKQKVKELESVTLEPYEKDGWQKFGRFFLENFIGQSEFAKECRIENYNVIKFRDSKINGELTAQAFEPLIIINEALGYKITYQLEDFTYTYKDRIVFYAGYPLYTPLEGNARRQKRWEKRRDDVYFGSQMHFMRSLYRNTLDEEGFVLRRLVKVTNEEKNRVRGVLRDQARAGKPIRLGDGNDSSNYYQKVLRQPDGYDMLDKNPIPADSVAFAYDKTVAGLDFKNYLWVQYTKEHAPPEYQSFNAEHSNEMVSTLYLINQRPIQIQADGNFFDAHDMISSGYWAWSEKMAMVLPFNYKPNKKAP